MSTRWLYFRLFGFSALIATGAYWLQAPGLALSTGVSPIAGYVDWFRQNSSFAEHPTLLWWSASDSMIQALCGACVVFSLLVLFDAAVPLALLGLFVCWGSLVNVAPPFLNFQWDIMLCEAAVLSIPYALWKARPAHLFPVLVAVKVTFESGVVKLTAGDASWWPDLTALTYHYWTQPIPAWTSVYIDRLPMFVHQASCFLMFVLELGVPLAAFGPRRARQVAAVGIIGLQVALALAGNYSYFNLLVAVLAVPLLDDGKDAGKPIGWAAFAATVAVSALVFVEQYGFKPIDAIDRVESFRLSSSYGVFRVMTKTRPEIIVEGSTDGVTWTPYEFPWKPGRLDRRPAFIAPWQPRLDWQMWFAALGSCQGNPWLVSMLRHLLLGTPQVLALFEETGPPPKLIRTTLWQYRFAKPGSSDWWERSDPQQYCPTVMLDGQGQLVRAP